MIFADALIMIFADALIMIFADALIMIFADALTSAILPAPKSISLWQVHVYAGASEVSVVYRVDEFSIELFVCLPENYPLQPPTIREGKRARVDPAQWRKWMLQLNVFMANQVIACFPLGL